MTDTTRPRPLVRISGLERRFPISKGVFRRTTDFVHAVDGIDLEIAPGESLGLVGESGCGKSTTGRLLARLDEPTAGRIVLHDDGTEVDIAHLEPKDMKRFRGRVQMIFQDPFESLNPRKTILDTVAEPLVVQNRGTADERQRRVIDLLARVGLTPPETFLYRHPHELSGGQRQRVAIARALIVDPTFVIADEPTSMLDVSIRISIMELMLELAAESGMAYLYITHDLAVARYMCDRIAVMYLGKVVEVAATEELLANPKHPYTRALLAAVPVPDPTHRKAEPDIRGGVSKAINPPPTCRFLDRCPWATDICATADHPALQDSGDDHHVACHLVTSVE